MGSQRENEAMAGLLRQRLAGEANAGSACLEPETLAAYFEHALEASEAKECNLHLSKCARCREQLVRLARSAQAGEGRAHESPRSTWLFDWRWLTAAAGAMALATLWFVHERGAVTPIKSPANLPAVAMNRAEPKPEAGVGGALGKDAKQAPAQALSREAASAKESSGLRKAAPLAAKKRPPAPPISESVTALGPPPASALQSRQTESDLCRTNRGRVRSVKRKQHKQPQPPTRAAWDRGPAERRRRPSKRRLLPHRRRARRNPANLRRRARMQSLTPALTR